MQRFGDRAAGNVDLDVVEAALVVGDVGVGEEEEFLSPFPNQVQPMGASFVFRSPGFHKSSRRIEDHQGILAGTAMAHRMLDINAPLGILAYTMGVSIHNLIRKLSSVVNDFIGVFAVANYR